MLILQNKLLLLQTVFNVFSKQGDCTDSKWYRVSEKVKMHVNTYITFFSNGRKPFLKMVVFSLGLIEREFEHLESVIILGIVSMENKK